MDPFLGEIRMFAGNFAPRGWEFCNGQLISIAQNTALFALLGVTYGGDGKTTFALPNLQARFPMHAGAGPGLMPRQLGEAGGVDRVQLTVAQMPGHTHGMTAAATANTGTPSAQVGLAPAADNSSIYRQPGARTPMDAATIGVAGTGAAHENRQPYLALNFIIAMQGIFPPRT